MDKFTKKKALLGALTIFVIGGVAGGATMAMSSFSMGHSAEKYSMQYNKEVISEQDDAIKNLIAEGRYKCCLEDPCSYCFSDPEHQDRELVCDCLVDIMNGKAPCGECIGEILEGKGNSLISEYFATAIAEEVGYGELPALKKIIADKYGISVEEQI